MKKTNMIIAVFIFLWIPNHAWAANENEWNRLWEWYSEENREYYHTLEENEWIVDREIQGWTDNKLKLTFIKNLAYGKENSLHEAKMQIDRIFNECNLDTLLSLYFSMKPKTDLITPLEILRKKSAKRDYFRWEYFKSIRPLDLKDFRYTVTQLDKIDNKIRNKEQIQGILRMLSNKTDYKDSGKLLIIIKKIIMDFDSISNLIEKSTKNEGIQIGKILANYHSDVLESEIFSMLYSERTPKKDQVIQMIRLEKVRRCFLNYEQFEVQPLIIFLKKTACLDLIWNKKIKKRRINSSKNNKILQELEDTSRPLRRSKRLNKHI